MELAITTVLYLEDLRINENDGTGGSAKRDGDGGRCKGYTGLSGIPQGSKGHGAKVHKVRLKNSGGFQQTQMLDDIAHPSRYWAVDMIYAQLHTDASGYERSAGIKTNWRAACLSMRVLGHAFDVTRRV